jgi:hypothetical protein
MKFQTYNSTKFFFLLFLTSLPKILLSGNNLPQWADLFNGKDLSGWVDVNTSPETWWVEDGLLKCSGKPIGVMRSEKQYENFLLHVEWRHMEAGGNSGIFAWSDAIPFGNRSKSLENRCKGKGEWNSYDVVCVDGVVKLSVNGKFVNGIRNSQYKKGYLCLESEGAEIHFRNLKILELPGGVISPEEIAPLAGK